LGHAITPVFEADKSAEVEHDISKVNEGRRSNEVTIGSDESLG